MSKISETEILLHHRSVSPIELAISHIQVHLHSVLSGLICAFVGALIGYYLNLAQIEFNYVNCLIALSLCSTAFNICLFIYFKQQIEQHIFPRINQQISAQVGEQLSAQISEQVKHQLGEQIEQQVDQYFTREQQPINAAINAQAHAFKGCLVQLNSALAQVKEDLLFKNESILRMTVQPIASVKLECTHFSYVPRECIEFCSTKSDDKFKFGVCYWNSGLQGYDIFVYLSLLSGDNSRHLRYRVSILDAHEMRIYSQEYTWNFNIKENSSHHMAKFINVQAFLDRFSWLKPISPHSRITCLCEVYEDDQEISRKSSCLSKDLQSLLKTGAELFDVTLQVGEREYGAHKAILTARSPILAELCLSQPGPVKITLTDIDDDCDTFELLLHYLYTDRLLLDKLNCKRAVILLQAAEKLQMEPLRWNIEQYLFDLIGIESVAELALVAHTYDLPILKSKCIEFITEKSDKVVTTDGWKELETDSNKFFHELSSKLAKK